MSHLRAAFARIAGLFTGRRSDDPREELEVHLEMETAEYIRRGMAPDAARRQALLASGGLTLAAEAVRDQRGLPWLESLWWDVRYAWRRLRRAPAFTVGIVLTFALGIGASAIAFTLLERLFLRAPAHLAQPDELRLLLSEQFVPWRGERMMSASLSYPDIEDLRQANAFRDVAAYSPLQVVLGEGPSARALDATLVSGNFFELLGVLPAAGRFFNQADDRIGEAGVVVLSHQLWRAHFGSDPSVIGRTVDIGRGPYTVVGVAPAGFTGATHERTDLWLPMRSVGAAVRGEAVFARRGAYWVRAVARLAPGTTDVTAEAEASVLHRAGRSEGASEGRADADPRVITASLIAGRHPQAPQEASVAIWIGAVSAMLLLIVCANIANLLLARGVRDRRETAVRMALGGGVGRLLRSAVVETLLLATLSAGAALLVAAWGGSALRAFLLPDVVWSDGALSPRLLAFVVLLTVTIGVLTGVLPAIRGTRSEVTDTLRSGGRAPTLRRSRLRDALLLFQTAVAVLLLVGAGLFVRSLHAVSTMDLGLDPDGVMLVRPVFDETVDEAVRADFLVRAAERLRRVPVVEHASATLSAPFHTSWSFDFRIPGRDSLPTPPSGGPYFYVTDHDFFATTGMRIVRGRGFLERDDAAATTVTVVNEAMAQLAWPDSDALGQCIVVGEANAPCATVVGVVKDARRYGLIEQHPQPQIFLSLAQGVVDEGPEALLVRAVGDPRAASEVVRNELLALDPRLRSAGVRHLTDMIAPQTRSWRLGAIVFSICGVLALLVAIVGLYAVLAFDVAQRVHEIGIRSALGAGRWRIVRLVVGQAGRFVLAGLVAGASLAWLTSPRIAELLHGVGPRDPMVFGAVTVTVLLIGASAAAWPAFRASRVEPQLALRSD